MEKERAKTKVENEINKTLSSFTEEQMKSLWVLLTMTQNHSVLWNWNIEEPYPTPTLQFNWEVMNTINLEDSYGIVVTEEQTISCLMRSAYDCGERMK